MYENKLLISIFVKSINSRGVLSSFFILKTQLKAPEMEPFLF